MIPDDLFDALCCGAREAIKDAWDAAQGFSSKVNPDEVDHIYAMTRIGVAGLGAHWGPLLVSRGLSLRITGVFCHQTPKASYTHPRGSKSPELADLLIVHEHKAALSGGLITTTRRAVLVQAKMVDQGLPAAVDPYQEYLYEHWPVFSLKGRGPRGASSFLPGARDLKPNTGGSRYGLIERTAHGSPSSVTWPFCCGFPWTFVDPNDPIRTAGGEDAGAFITNMLYSTIWPRGRVSTPPTYPLALVGSPNNHFDVTVEELLTLTAKKTLGFRRKSHVMGDRGEEVACWQISAGPLASLPATGRKFTVTGDAYDREPPPERITEEDDGGMSVMLIETGGSASGRD